MAENQKPQISIKGVLERLNNGKTREEIGAEFGLSKNAIKSLFKHPQLKGRKTKSKAELPFEIIEDAPDAPVSKFGPKKKKAVVTEASTETEATTETGEVSQATGEQESSAENENAKKEPKAPAKKIETQKGSW